MRGFWALVWLELLTVARDRTMKLMLVMAPLLGAGSLPLVAVVQESASETELPDGSEGDERATKPCPEGDRPDLAVDGVLPDWFIWPEPLVQVEAAAVVARVVEHDGVPVFTLLKGTGEARDQRAVQHCLWEQIRGEKARRLENLGVEPMSIEIDRVVLGEPSESPWWPISVLGSLLATLALVTAGSLAIEAVPRRRSSGLLEQLRSTQTSPAELVSAWLFSISAFTLVQLGLATLFFAGSALFYPNVGGWLPGLHAGPFAVLIAAATVRTSLNAEDVQSASLRWFAVVFGLAAATCVAALLIDRPWLAALIPMGGSALACSGFLGPWGWLADLAALGWSAGLVSWCAARLRDEESSMAGFDPALARQAAGNYLPEALFLGAMGFGAAVVSSAALFGSFWIGVIVSFAIFMVLPSMLAPWVLGVKRTDLLPLHPPGWINIALAVPMVVGCLGLATMIVVATQAVLPPSPMVDAFAKMMAEIPVGIGSVLLLGLLPAIAEEFLFRGAIQGLLLKSGRPWLANIGQALAFAVTHVVSIRLPWTFVFGLIAGWMRQRTGSLWPGMALHFLLNVTLGTLGLLAAGEPSLADAASLWMAVPLLLGLAALPFYRNCSKTVPASV